MRRWVAGLVLGALVACSREQAAAPEPEANIVEDDLGSSTAAVAVPPSATSAKGRVSRFTKLDEASCGPMRVVDETGDWDRTCKGVDGYALKWSSGDLREDLSIATNGRETLLGIPVKVAKGAFDSIGQTVEWRGPRGKKPDVVVVRVKVANDQGEDDGGHLAIARLGRSPCIVAVVRPAPGQSGQARAIADGDLSACLER